MLKIYRVQDQKGLNDFINNTMNWWNDNVSFYDSFGNYNRYNGWAFIQPDCGKVNFPAQFVIVEQPDIKLATIQILH